MAILAVLAILAGLVQIPGVTHVVENFLHPTFEDSRFADVETSTGVNVLALVVGAITSLTGIGLAFYMYVRSPGTSLRLVRALPAGARVPQEQVVLRRGLRRAGRAADPRHGQALSNVFERVVIDGMMSGTAQVVRGGNSVVRAVQSGLLRNYALLLATGVTALALYFLVVSR